MMREGESGIRNGSWQEKVSSILGKYYFIREDSIVYSCIVFILETPKSPGAVEEITTVMDKYYKNEAFDEKEEMKGHLKLIFLKVLKTLWHCFSEFIGLIAIWYKQADLF